MWRLCSLLGELGALTVFCFVLFCFLGGWFGSVIENSLSYIVLLLNFKPVTNEKPTQTKTISSKQQAKICLNIW